MKKTVYILTIFAILTVGCTDLKEGIYDKFVADDFYKTEAGINAALADVYKEIRGDWGGIGIAGADRGWYDLNEACTDEMMIPTRSDGAWADNGIWLQMYKHTWTSGQAFMENTWNWLFRAVFKANLAIELLTASNAPESAIAEAKVLRAYFYYLLMDGWGGVPIVTATNTLVENVKQGTRQEVFNFVVSELTANLDKVKAPANAAEQAGIFYNRFHRWAGYTILAKIYLNAQVYTGTPKWAEAITTLDKVITQGGYSLVAKDKYFGMFDDNCNDDGANEVIFALFIDADKAPRNIIGIRSLYGPHGDALFKFSTWNGATVHQDFVNKYEDGDIRKTQWLVGAQPGGTNYAVNISSLENAGIQEGARNAKFLPVAPYNGGAASNDYPVYRLADVLLMKAEALVRNGQAGSAKELVDQVRTRAGISALASAPTLEDIYDERGRELSWEGHRRQDMIRFDKFLAAHDFKTTSAAKYKLFPIPASALANNKTLVQNPGY